MSVSKTLASTADLPDPVPCPKCGQPSRLASAGGACLTCMSDGDAIALLSSSLGTKVNCVFDDCDHNEERVCRLDEITLDIRGQARVCLQYGIPDEDEEDGGL